MESRILSFLRMSIAKKASRGVAAKYFKSKKSKDQIMRILTIYKK